jgi:uncharacterized protein YegL
MFGFIRAKGRDGSMTLMSTQITGAIVDSFCSLEVVQRFINKSPGGPCECAFLMEGTDRYVIYDIQIVKGREALVFNIRALKDEELTAIGGYDTMAFSKSTNDILLNIGIVPPDTIIQVSYGVSFNGRLTSATELAFDIPYNDLNANTIAFMDITIENAFGVEKADVGACRSTFSITRLTFAHEVIRERPVVVVKTSKNIESSAIAVVLGSHRYIGLSLVPEVRRRDVLSEIFFLVDCSGSMEGVSIQCARETLRFLARKLPSSCYFQVIFFSETYKSLFEESAKKNEASLAKLDLSLASMNAGGGTQLYEPLEFIYRTEPRAGYVRQIFILTDGQVSREADILALVARNRGAQRIFSLGIGPQVARAFIEEVATRSTGHAVFVDAESLTAAAREQLSHALTPSVASPEVEVGASTAEVAPFPIPPLFHQSVSNVYIRTEDTADAAVLVTGTDGSSTFQSVVAPRVGTGKIELMKFHAFLSIKDLHG